MPDSLPAAKPQTTARKALRYTLQAVAYGAFAAFIGYFSTSPTYRLRGEDNAVVKLSFSHSAQLRQACRTRSDAELAKLAPNMRTKMDCPRERAPVTVELDMDGQPLYRITTQPTGLHQDGAATVYRRLEIPAGRHLFHARMADSADGSFQYKRDIDLELAPGEVIIVDFLRGEGGFVFTRG
ncbi:MAG: hypothetical protein RIR09_3143 [Pseudomonadota bacterium]|jgi:hypothetical protein